jgi:hypothetical protein
VHQLWKQHLHSLQAQSESFCCQSLPLLHVFHILHIGLYQQFTSIVLVNLTLKMAHSLLKSDGVIKLDNCGGSSCSALSGVLL